MKILDGKRYNTETAEKLCDLPCNVYSDDFGWHKTALYVTTSGAFFLAGEGNASSMWGQSAPGGGSIPGEGIRPIERDEARKHLEDAGEDYEIERLFEVTDA
ncbi:hypothetical protein [Hansschlegelia sp. KR7-227]|uniref:hypothetical protein n=1 Tax=Hansschlegelia sp. KR7-227 TaxID=3400914 RepID=UPI003C09E7C0